MADPDTHQQWQTAGGNLLVAGSEVDTMTSKLPVGRLWWGGGESPVMSMVFAQAVLEVPPCGGVGAGTTGNETSCWSVWMTSQPKWKRRQSGGGGGSSSSGSLETGELWDWVSAVLQQSMERWQVGGSSRTAKPQQLPGLKSRCDSSRMSGMNYITLPIRWWGGHEPLLWPVG